MLIVPPFLQLRHRGAARLGPPSQGPGGCSPDGSQAAVSSEGSVGEGPPPSSLMCLLAAFSSSGYWPETSAPQHVGLSTEQVATWHWPPSETARASARGGSHGRFRNLILTVTSHHFQLSVESELLGPVHTQGEGIIEKQNTRRRRSLGTTFKAAYHAYPFPASSEPTPRSGPPPGSLALKGLSAFPIFCPFLLWLLCTFCLELLDISSAQYSGPEIKFWP